MHYLGAMVQLKEQLRNNPADLQVKNDLEHTLFLFMNNIRCF
jgi:hypothetical protein